MAILARSARTDVVAAGFTAGLIGGILIDAFLFIANHANPIQVYQFVASGLVGPAAFSAVSYAWLGLVLHFFISIVFGVVYASAAAGLPALSRHPVVSGLVYGVLVMIVMMFVTTVRHLAPAGAPDARVLIVNLIGHTVFFGLPVAWYVNRIRADAANPART